MYIDLFFLGWFCCSPNEYKIQINDMWMKKATVYTREQRNERKVNKHKKDKNIKPQAREREKERFSIRKLTTR